MSYLVYAVDSADRLTLLAPPKPDNTLNLSHVALSYINAPKVARRTADGQFGPEDPCAFEAVEFVRNACIGKVVKFVEDYSIEALQRRAGRVTLAGGEDLSLMLLKNGFASVMEHAPARADKALLSKYATLTQEARAAKKGIFAPNATRSARHLVDLSREELAKVGERVRGTEVLVRVEQVLLASVLMVSAETFGSAQIAVHMPGITIKDPDCMTLSTAARSHVERYLLHRRVNILFEGVDTFGNILGSVTSLKGNFQTELLSRGFVKLNGTTLGFAKQAAEMQAAEKDAQTKHLGVWKNSETGKPAGALRVDYRSAAAEASGLPTTNNDGSAGPEYKGPLVFNAVVVQIVNGDTIVVRSEENGDLVRLSLAGVRSSKNVAREQDGRAAETRVTYSDYEWEAREFLRTRYIGKRVMVQVEFARQIMETKEVRPVGVVTIPETGVNINISLLETGYVTFFLGRNDVCSAASLLQAASEHARATGVGQHSKATPASVKTVELSHLGSAGGKYYLSFLQRGMQGNRPPLLKGIVDVVLGASSLRVYVPREHFQIPVKVAGIIAPMGSAAGGNSEKPDAFADESKNFAVDMLQQREVEIQVHTADRAGNFISTVFLSEGNVNYALAVVEAGLATVANADRLPYQQQLVDAERRAQAAKKCIWADGAKIPQRAAKLEAQKNALNSRAFTCSAGQLAEFAPYNLSEVGEDGFSVYLQERSETAEQQRGKLQSIVNQTVSLGSEHSPKRGELVVAQYREDKTWNRAKVMHAPKGEQVFEVLFIDFGTRGEVRGREMRMIPRGPEFAIVRDTPPLAQLVHLAFLRKKVPADTNMSHTYDTVYDYADGAVIAREVYRDGAGGQYFTVTVNENVASLSETLLQRGFALLDRAADCVDDKEYKRHEAAQDIARVGHKGMWQYGDIDDDSDME